jgi:hypothetical protein
MILAILSLAKYDKIAGDYRKRKKAMEQLFG